MATADAVLWLISYVVGNLFDLRFASVCWINSIAPAGYHHDVTIATDVEISLQSLRASLARFVRAGSGP